MPRPMLPLLKMFNRKESSAKQIGPTLDEMKAEMEPALKALGNLREQNTVLLEAIGINYAKSSDNLSKFLSIVASDRGKGLKTPSMEKAMSKVFNASSEEVLDKVFKTLKDGDSKKTLAYWLPEGEVRDKQIEPWERKVGGRGPGRHG